MENTSVFFPREVMSQEVLAQAQLMMAREKFWTPSIEKLLRRWIYNISLRQKGHRAKEKKYYVYFYILSIPNMLISAGLTSSIFATYSSTSSGFQIFLGILSLISTFIVSFMTLMKFSESAALHRASADEYQELSNYIILLTKLPKLQRGDPVIIIKEIMDRFNNIEKSALDISNKYRKDLDYEVEGQKSNEQSSNNKKKKTIKAPKASDIFDSNDDKTDKLTELLLSNFEEGVLEKEQLQKDIEQKNDYDTDDDEKKVTLEIDPESLMPGETAPKSDYYSMMKDALKKTLNVDLNRYYNNGGDAASDTLNSVSKSPLLSPRNKSYQSNFNLNKSDDLSGGKSAFSVGKGSPRNKNTTDSPRSRSRIDGMSTTKHSSPSSPSMIKSMKSSSHNEGGVSTIRSPRPITPKKSNLKKKSKKRDDIIPSVSSDTNSDRVFDEGDTLKNSNSSTLNNDSFKDDVVRNEDNPHN